MNHLVRNPELSATWQWEKNLPYLTPGLLIMKNKTPLCNKTRLLIFFFTHIISHIDQHSSIFSHPSHPWLLFSFLLSLYSCHDKCQTQSVRSFFFIFFLSFFLATKVCWDKTAVEASHWSTSIRYLCESNRNVWRCCHKLTGSNCLCAPEGNSAFSPLLSPPSLLLF